jgi:hypothetical protein
VALATAATQAVPVIRNLTFLACLITVCCALSWQTIAAQDTARVEARLASVTPVIDGIEDDQIWHDAPLIGGFREVRPSEDSTPRQNTAFRVGYDAENLYVFVRLYDTHVDSIVKRLSRRDEGSTSDHVTIMVDSYHDRRTGFEFQVNPAGVKADYAIYNDGEEDSAWDAVWDVATRLDSLGWTAEFRIPFSQLRFTPSENVTFGFMVWRNLQRYTAQASWPLYRQSRTGFVSQFGMLTGLRGLSSPRRAELVPYLVAQSEPEALTMNRQGKLSAGGDLRYALASNLMLNATVNPDFGQVEADPAELNLSAFETFFDERRPFFVAGAELFDFRVNCFVVVDCSTGEGLFYSRRIGRSPELAGLYGDAATPTSTRILGAAKLTGRLPGGLAVGLLDAVTERVGGFDDQTVEPLANYALLRVSQDLDGGSSGVGVLLTSTQRSLDEHTDPYLHSSALTGGLDARRRLGRFEISGSVMASRVAGSKAAINRTQQRPAHYYQRPDDGLALDPTRTSLSGHAVELRVGKVGGERSRFETGYARRSAGFEINDIGFLNRANEQTFTNWFALRWNAPNAIYQRLNWNFNFWQHWTLEGLPTERAFNSNVHVQFNNRWWLHAGGTLGLGDVYCDRDCTRGGPALKVEPAFRPWVGIEGDGRKMVVPSLWLNFTRADGGRTSYISANPQITVRPSSRFSTSFSFNVSRNQRDAQWFGNITDDAGDTQFLFAALDQRTLGVTWRLNYTFSPTASLQWYANPFVSKGTYSRLRELNDPRAAQYDDRFRGHAGDATEEPAGFNVRRFTSNAVFRWEYLPGSTLFLVWNQGRQMTASEQGTETFGGDIRELFGERAEDRFLVKVSYWINK